MDEIRKCFTENSVASIEVSICSTFTDGPMGDYIKWWLTHFEFNSDIKLASYNQVFQELYSSSGVLSNIKNGVSILLIRFEDLIKDSKKTTEEKKIMLKKQFDELTDIITNNMGNNKRIVCVLPVSEHIMKTQLGMYIEDLNSKWFSILEKIPQIDVIDMRILKNKFKIKKIYNQYTDKLAHIPYCDEYYSAMATDISRKICSYYRPPFKVIVVDCDNTLWNGVCGEVGANNVFIDRGYGEFQKFLIKCYNKGMLLAICSKNNEEDVMEVFTNNPYMQLKKNHFVSMKINWENKFKNIKEIAKELNLGLDSFIFLDDSGVECSEMMIKCPEVLTINMPEDSSLFMEYLSNIWAFDINNVSEEDKYRTRYYLNDKKRKESRSKDMDLKDFIKSLDVKVHVYLADEADSSRISQLTQRTNQFNLTTKRMTQGEIIDVILNDEIECYLIEVEDKFGAYGITGTMIVKYTDEYLILDTFLLSCRVLGRGVENQLLSFMKLLCERKNLSKIKAYFFQTARNNSFKEFLFNNKWTVQTEENDYNVFNLNIGDIFEESTVLTKRPSKKKNELETINEENEVSYCIDHIGVAVDNMKEALNYYDKLGYKLHEPVYDPMQDVYLVMGRKEGHLPIELVASSSEDSPVNQYLEYGNYISYHICIRIKSFEIFKRELDLKNIKYDIISSPKEAILFNNKKVGFVLIKSIGIVEIIEDEIKEIEKIEIGEKDTIKILTTDLEKAESFFYTLGYERIENSKKNKSISMKNQISVDIELESKNYIHQKNDGDHSIILSSYIDDMDELIKSIKQNNIEFEVMDISKDYDQSNLSNIQLKDSKQIYYSDKKVDNKKEEFKILITNEKNLKYGCYYLPLKYWNGEISKELINIAKTEEVNNTEIQLEEKILQLSKSIFNKKEIEIDDNFYKIGFNSLKIIKLLSKIYELYKVEIPLSNVFKNPSIRGIVSYIDEKSCNSNMKLK